MDDNFIIFFGGQGHKLQIKQYMAPLKARYISATKKRVKTLLMQ